MNIFVRKLSIAQTRIQIIYHGGIYENRFWLININHFSENATLAIGRDLIFVQLNMNNGAALDTVKYNLVHTADIL